MSADQRMSLLAKAVAPQLDYRCSRWPPQRVVAQELDCMQRKMVSTVLRTPRHPGEDTADFVKRRGRIAGRKCRSVGQWSQRWFTRAVEWNEYLKRPRNCQTWASKLIHYRNRQWFIERRASLLPVNGFSGSCIAGRTETRAVRGCVHTRWHDGIEFAKNH